MKPGHKYYKNPAPFALVVANPKRGKKRAMKKRRNPAKRSSAGVFVIRKPSRNPIMKTKRRKVRTATKKRRNPAKLEHVLLLNPRKKRRATAKRRRNVSKKRRTVKRRKIFSRNPMKTRKRRRGHRRSRNPMARTGAKRRSGRRRSSRRRSFMRNPLPIVRDVFSSDILATTGGVLGGSVLANTVISKLVMGNATGVRSFDLPGVDYTMLVSTDPLVRATFYTKNAWMLGFYKLIVGAGTGLVLRRYSPRLGAGVIAGGMLAAGTTILQANNLLTASGTLVSRGTGRVLYPGQGVGLLPGTPTRFTGPAQQFLRNGVPQPRGMGARVGPNTMPTMMAQSEGQFRGAN